MTSVQTLRLAVRAKRALAAKKTALSLSVFRPKKHAPLTDVRLQVRGLSKVFADKPEQALSLLADGAGKEKVLSDLGQSVGVNNATFDVRTGEIFVIMGLSGSGKSTLVRLLNRLIEPSAGSIILDGVDLARMSNRALIDMRRRDMSMVFQSFALLPHLTALDNAAFGLAIAGVPKKKRRAMALEALGQVGLAEYAGRYPHEMSGGMQQRVGLARALANNPTIMLMDEAFSALDPLIRCEMQDALLRLQQQHQRTIIFISHDLDEAMRIGDRIAIMRDGQIVQIGTPTEIVRSPADDYVRSFFHNVDIARVLCAGDVAVTTDLLTVPAVTDPAAALWTLKEGPQKWAYVIDDENHFIGVLDQEKAGATTPDTAADCVLSAVQAVREDVLLHDILGLAATCPCPLPVVDEDGVFVGVVTPALILETLDRSEGHGV